MINQLAVLLSKVLKLQQMVCVEHTQKGRKQKSLTLSELYGCVKQSAYDLGLLILFEDYIPEDAQGYIGCSCYIYDVDSGERLKTYTLSREEESGSSTVRNRKMLLMDLLNISDKEMDAMLEPAPESKGKRQKQEDTVCVNGKVVPKSYYQACVYTLDGEKLLSIYSKDRERFNEISKCGDPNLELKCQIITDYKQEEERRK